MLLADRYKLEKPLGEGGMGVVYRGFDIKTEALVAIKKLRRDTLQHNPQALERFNREAQALRDLNHPNIVKAFTAFEQQDDHYIVMEYVDGHDLQHLIIQEGRLPLVRVVRLGLELSDALTRAHYLRIIHRDIKPANILIDSHGIPKLSDFGVAYLETQERVTGMGISVGTPAYMAPEILNGKPASERSDLWALGLILFEMLIARHPFRGDNLSELLINVMTQPLPDLELQRPDCPVALADLIYRLLERNPDGRISSARIVGLELEKLLGALETQSIRATDVMPQLHDTPLPEQRTLQIRAKTNLPAQTTPFIGRERELADLIRLISDPDTRLITVLGAGGIGKTRLALATAATCLDPHPPSQTPPFQHGVYLIELAALTNPDPLLTTIANTIGFPFNGNASLITQLSDYLRDKSLLLVLDNFEHILGGATILNEVLRAAPHLKVIVTSRERLNLTGETVYALDGLELPDSVSDLQALAESPAVQLFIQSAARAQLGYSPAGDDLVLIHHICQMMDGLPLGIVLAAAWIQNLSLREILDEIRRGLDFLETELSDIPSRHRSIRAVFDHTWLSLSPDEQTLLAKLSVFRGGLSRRAGAEVAGATLRALAALVNKSLLRRDPDVGSYHMHELLRQYAEGELEKSGKADEVRAAHSRYYLGTLSALRSSLEGGAQVETLHNITDDIENVRAAWDWATMTGDLPWLALAMPSLSVYFRLIGQYEEGEIFLEKTATRVRQIPESKARDYFLGELLAHQAVMAIVLHHREIVDRLLAESVALLDEAAPPFARAMLEFARGYDHLTLKKPVDARPYFERAAVLYRTLGNRWALAQTISEWSHSYWYRTDGAETDLDRARDLLNDALTIQRSLGDIYGLAAATLRLGTVESYAGNDAEDARLTAEAHTLFQQIGNLYEVSNTLNNMGVRELMNGNYAASRPYLEQSLRIKRDLGGVVAIAWGLYVLARLSHSEGDFPAVIQRANEGLALVARSIHLEWELTLLFSRAQASWALGDYNAALADYSRTEELAKQLDNQEDVLYTLNRRGVVALAMRDDEQAQRWLTQAQTEAESKEDQTTAFLSQALLARLQLYRGNIQAAHTLIDAPARYFTSEEAWQTSYSTDPWQMSSYVVETLITQADIIRAATTANNAEVKATLSAALKTAHSINSPAHILAVAAAYAEYIAIEQPRFAAVLAARIATHRAAYAIDKARVQPLLNQIATSAKLQAEDFAQACLDGETLPLEAVTLPMTEALSG